MAEADILVSCPYNPAHRIRRYKLMTHMVKCKKSSNNVQNKVECPLDKSHVVDRDYLKEHIKLCPSKGKLIEIDTGLDVPKMEAVPPIMGNPYNSTENWDEEPEVPAYNPMDVSAKKPVIRMLSGLTKSERRKFKESERMRIANLKGYHSASAASSSTRDTSMRETHEIPLRPPRDILPITILSDNLNNVQIHDHDRDDRDTNMQASFVPELHNNSFHTNNSFHSTLYDELAPEDDNINQSEHSLRVTEMDAPKIPLREYFQNTGKGEANYSMSDQNQKTNVNKTEIDATSEPFNVANTKKEKNENIANTSNVSGERVTDRLLALLKNESGIKEVQFIKETVKVDQINKDSECSCRGARTLTGTIKRT
ncbi:uncharacterized protein LOC105829478 isoform X2 [Monomorium pharaonis]|uniref:uncharacterized protein LOC105829478 isoform X2 n=1 Tax=Monomorium pharaonis TaxID=307658 RepID=UPI00063F943E|nr:uncharacterized protein LOC105829478 isoform X2 [Monomorium pharaonis]